MIRYKELLQDHRRSQEVSVYLREACVDPEEYHYIIEFAPRLSSHMNSREIIRDNMICDL